MQSYNSFNEEPQITTDYYNNVMPYTLRNNVCYKSNVIDGKTLRIRIAKGFKFNGADIIKVLWIFVGSRFNPEYLPASCVHDFCTRNKPKFTNKQASVIFRDLLIAYGVNPIKANVMGLAVYIYQQLWFNKGWKK